MIKAVFLDRDGTINECFTERVKIASCPEQFYLLPHTANAVALIRQKGYKVFVVTNQSGVHFGYISKQMLDLIHENMIQQLFSENPHAIIEDVIACPHHPEAGCVCRKPKPGMIQNLARKYNIDLSRSWMLGDRESDIEAGQAAGCETLLLPSNHGIWEFAQKLG